jgi:anaerobic selenocysteine-containing dehydrogenase
LAGAAAGCRLRRDPYAAEKPPVPVERGLRPGSEKFVFTTCGLCPAGCGLRVRVVDGRAVKVEGNAESPVNRGGVCVRGQAGLELLYHPDRIRGPRRRVGERGENRWQAISWDEAIAQLASELSKLRAAGEPESLVLLDGEQTGTTHALWSRLLEVFGSPNHIGHGPGCAADDPQSMPTGLRFRALALRAAGGNRGAGIVAALHPPGARHGW